MPCYYTGSLEGDLRLDAKESRTALTEVTRMLCEVLQSNDDHAGFELSPEVRAWWDKHKAVDESAKWNKAIKEGASFKGL